LGRVPVLIATVSALFLLSTCPFTVAETESAIITRFGRPLHGVLGPGLHWKLPWPVDSVVRVDRRLLLYGNPSTEMLTADKKNVLVESFLCWRVGDPQIFAQTVKTRAEAEARLLDLSVSELGAAVGGEPMESFINAKGEKVRLRAVASGCAQAIDRVAAERFGIRVVDLQISGFNLPLQNRASVIDRMRAERERMAAKYRSEGEEEALKIQAAATAEREGILAEARSKAEAVRGKGEADALRALAAAYGKDAEFYRFLRSLETYEKVLDEKTTIFMQSDSKLLRTLDGK
jgi:modulator of FtsH protease HflC